MTMGKISVTVGFAVVTTSQFVFGLYSSILVATEGGKVGRSDEKNRSHLEGFPTPL